MLLSCGKSLARITAHDIKFPSRLPEGADPKSVQRVSIHLGGGGGGGVVEGLNVRVGSCFCCQEHSEAEVAFNKGTGFGSSEVRVRDMDFKEGGMRESGRMSRL